MSAKYFFFGYFVSLCCNFRLLRFNFLFLSSHDAVSRSGKPHVSIATLTMESNFLSKNSQSGLQTQLEISPGLLKKHPVLMQNTVWQLRLRQVANKNANILICHVWYACQQYIAAYVLIFSEPETDFRA